MTDPAVIAATFSDWRPVKSRKVLQLIFEVPVEKTELVLNTLGAPMPHEDNWCAIAVLTEEARSLMAKPGAHNAHDAGSNPAAPTKRRFDEMSRAQQAGLMCADKQFRRWLYSVELELWRHCGGDAAAVVRSLCNVKSRSELDSSDVGKAVWDQIMTDYRHATGRLAEQRG